MHLCRGGFFTAKDWLDDNRRAVEEAHALEADCLVLVIAFYNAVVRYLATLQIDNEPEYQRLLAEFPFPAE